ncbi:MAG: lipocalin-like domain-containing protein [Prevotellaceae bacterium]|nr:lipocalin-like domain-containing protein [Prevotellaceae bacterium]
MKQYKNILFVSLFAMIVWSCELETSGNGDLDGMWHLVRIDTLSTSGTNDLSNSLIFWSFQNKLMETSDKTKNNPNVLFRFDRTGTEIKFYNPYINDREDGDLLVVDPLTLSPYGINGLEETFTIESLSGSKMILSTSRLRLNFVKM